MTRSHLLVSFLVMAGCGGGATSPDPALPAAATGSAAAADAPDPAASDAPTTSDPAPAASSAPSEVATPPATGPDAARDVTYRPQPGLLLVEVTGVEFKLTAKPVALGAGFGVDLVADVVSTDSAPHSLLVSDGPFAIAARVGSGDVVPDRRDQDEERILVPGEAVHFTRRWPGKDAKAVARGSEAKLTVALWGLGSDAANRRPIRPFFVVKLVVPKTGKPVLLVLPPDQ